MPFIRLYLVPVTPSAAQQVIDVDDQDLVLSNGAFIPVQVAKSLTLVGHSIDSTFQPFAYSPVPTTGLSFATAQQQEIRVCYREPVADAQFADPDVITSLDPSGGQCICAITCQGTQIAYAQVKASLAAVA